MCQVSHAHRVPTGEHLDVDPGVLDRAYANGLSVEGVEADRIAAVDPNDGDGLA